MLRSLLASAHKTTRSYANKGVLQVFALLMFEMGIFMLLIVPLPYTMKRKIFTFISDNPLVAKLQYGMKVGTSQIYMKGLLTSLQITFIFILILFVDSVNRVYRVQVELSMAKNQGGAAYAKTFLNILLLP